MSAFPSLTLDREYVRLRFLEPRFPQAVDQRWVGMPRGVYIGFTPQVTPGSDVLTLAVDANHGFSLVRTGSETVRAQVAIFTDSDMTLDFSGHFQWPVYVIARADFRDGQPTNGRILTRSTTASGISGKRPSP